MALIKCPACTANVSDRAAACMKCGCSISGSVSSVNASSNLGTAAQPTAPINVSAFLDLDIEDQPKKSANKATIVTAIGIVCAVATAAVVFALKPNPEKLFEDGQALVEAKNYTEAIDCFSKAIKARPKEAQYYHWRGAVRLNTNDYGEAIRDYSEAIRLDPGNAFYRFSRGEAYSSGKDYNNAIADYSEAIKLNPNEASYRNNRGNAYRLKEDYDRAISDHTQAIRINPNDARYYNNRGVAYLLIKDYDNAAINYTEAIRLAPDNARYRNNRGSAHSFRKDFDSAVEDFTVAVRLDPDNNEYSKNLDKATRDQAKSAKTATGSGGKRVVSADTFGKSGFAADIDALLSGVAAAKYGENSGGSSNKATAQTDSERKSVTGSGYSSGFRSGGIDDLLNTSSGGGGLDLRKRSETDGDGLDRNKRSELKISSDFMKGGAMTGGRSHASIQRVVQQNMSALRKDYDWRKRDKPELSGKIIVKFAINEYGKVIFAQKVESTLADAVFERTVVDRIRSWDFGRIDKPGDVEEVTFPFVFSD